MIDMICIYIFSLVIEALKDVDPERRCLRMIGGVLVERTVKEVLPALINNHQQVRNNVPYVPSCHQIVYMAL